MAMLATVDLGSVAQVLGIALPQVEAVVRLLDDDNTVPFITRYRKDQTGGLDEEQIRAVEQRVVKARLLAERKQTILRSIESQGKLTAELAEAILAAETTRRLEDLYLPYKPRKQTLATTARQRGLEPLALEILKAEASCADLDARAADFVNSDRQVKTAADALLGAGHILAEMFSERADLRGRLRTILERTGMLVTTAAEPEVKAESKPAVEVEPARGEATAAGTAPAVAHAVPPAGGESGAQQGAGTSATGGGNDADAGAAAAEEAPAAEPMAGGGAACAAETKPQAEQSGGGERRQQEPPGPGDDCPAAVALQGAGPSDAGLERQHGQEDAAATRLPEAAGGLTAEGVEPGGDAPTAGGAEVPLATTHEVAPAGGAASTAQAAAPAADRHGKKKRKKKPAQKSGPDLRAYRDYFQYRESLARVPPHRTLAINRGERAKALKVRLECDVEAMHRVVDELLVGEGHPHAEFLRGCGRDALNRLVLPSLEREVRRELTETAESHAVEVFARNLRNLLLQPPVRDRRVLAVDPGYKSGCKVVALDEFGNLLDHAIVYLVGNEQRRTSTTARAVEMIRQQRVSVVAIGNGTACRDAERWISELLAGELADSGVKYVIVNEAGASVYSTSRLGREELPGYDATVRGAISIGRRLQDPLSELVKIDAANIGVGMYQHDVKAKHLRESLDAVVESCVNYVGVDVNTSSPALLRYVSGLNQLTAQRLYDYRTANGPFKNRESLKEVSGFGEGTFVQAAGFLKIAGGDNPLDATFIHPESYAAAEQVLRHFGFEPSDLTDKEKVARLAEKTKGAEVEQLAREVNIGALTLADILAQLSRPGRDPREELPPPVFKSGILKLEDLKPGLELSGTVLNVVDFGAFVDIGLKDSGLVHISQLADRYVQDPHEVVAVGDIVKVWVLDVDKDRRRVSLTMIVPGTRKGPEGRHGPRREAQGGGDAAGVSQRPAGGRRERRDGKRGKGKKPQAPAAPVQYVSKPKARPAVKLTKDKREGKAPLQTFGELFQFFQEKDEGQRRSGDTPS